MDRSSTARDANTHQNVDYKFASFVLKSAEPLLEKNGKEVDIEPKVLALLLYFCSHNERYIPASELHEQVWQGRVVSDAAVRRAISKLRTILGDDPKEPRFIKSVSKRGYRFICPIDECRSRLEFIGVKKARDGVKHLRAYLIGLFILVCISAGLAFHLWSGQHIEEYLVDYPGEKMAMATTADEKWTAFSGRVADFQGFQLFLRDYTSGTVHQLTRNAHNVSRLVFSQDEQSIIFVDLNPGQSQIKRIDLQYSSLSSSRSHTLVSDFQFISDIMIDKKGGLFFNGRKTKDDVSKLYHLDLATQVLSLSYASRDRHVYKSRLSPTGKHVAMVSIQGNATSEQQVAILNLENRNIEKRINYDKPVFDLEWIGQEKLLILDSFNLVEINLENSQRRTIKIEGAPKIFGMQLIDDDMLVLLDEPKSSYFVEYTLPDLNINAPRVMPVSSDVSQLLYRRRGDDFILRRDEGKRRVVSGVEDSKESVFLSTNFAVELFDVSNDGNMLLVRSNEKFALLNTLNGKITYITHGDSQVGVDAAFSLDSRRVLYGEKVAGVWSIKEYIIELKKHNTLFQGYKSAQPFASGYVLLDPQDKAFQYDLSTGIVVPLEARLATDRNTRWFVRNNKIYWTSFDYKDTYFNTFSISSRKTQSVKLSTGQVSPKFHIDRFGSKLLFKKNKPLKSNIHKVIGFL